MTVLYELLESERPDVLSKKVQQCLNNGWKLHGYTLVDEHGFVQAVTKDDDSGQ